MSTFTYNGVTLSNISTQAVDQVPVYSDDKADYLYSQITIKVQGWLNAALSPALANEPPAQTFTRVRACLTKPRGTLTFTDSQGNNIVVSPPAGATIDAKNGPEPGTLSITQITPTTFCIEYSVTTWLYECCSGSTTPPYISNRWVESVSLDENLYTRYTRRGRLIFRSDVLKTGGTNADDYRNVILAGCPLKTGFKRVTSSYTLQSDGLAVDYEYVDQEVYVVPPNGATTFRGTYRVNTQKSAVFNEEFHIEVTGGKNTPKADLFNICAVVAGSRLNPGGGGTFVPSEGGKTIMSGYFEDALHENSVTMHLSLIAQPFNKTFYGFFVDPNVANRLDPDRTALFNERTPPDPGTRSVAGLHLMANVLQDPCLTQFISTLTTQAGSTLVALNPNITTPTFRTAPLIPPTPTVYVPAEMTTGQYTDYRARTWYEFDEHTVQFPVASSSVFTASFVNTANRTMRRVVEWTVEAVGKQPTLPAFGTTDPNEVTLKSWIVPENVDVEADSTTRRWRYSGRYEFGVIDPTAVTMYSGRAPYIGTDYTLTAINSAQFTTGLTTPTGSTLKTF